MDKISGKIELWMVASLSEKKNSETVENIMRNNSSLFFQKLQQFADIKKDGDNHNRLRSKSK